MKRLLLLLATLSLCLAANAQNELAPGATNTAPEMAAPADSSGQTNITKISSDHLEFQTKTNLATYSGNVRVVDPRMILTCDLLTVKLPAGGGRPEYIVAERNVVIDARDKENKPIHATCNKAVYTYKIENLATNELLVLTGNSQVLQESNALSGDPIIWDLIQNKLSISQVSTSFSVKEPSKGATNQPVASQTHTNTP